MKISNIKNLNYKNYNSVCMKSAQNRITVPKMEPDVVSFRGGEVKCFDKLTSKTINQLYNATFIPSGIKYGELLFPTSVLDRISGKPVEVVVAPYRIDKVFEEYHILDPNNGFRKIGKRLFSYEGGSEFLIYSGSMESDSKKYKGIGTRLHQIAIERMMMRNFKNLEIYSTAEAYPFHKKCGFEPYKEIDIYEQKYFDKFVKCSASSLGLDEESVKKMIIYNKEFDIFSVNINATNGNFIDYMHSNRSKFEDGWWLPYCAYMRLSPEAAEEWTKFVNKTPIFTGDELPPLYRRSHDL